MDMETVWKHCHLCDAHFKSNEITEHNQLWHSEGALNESGSQSK